MHLESTLIPGCWLITPTLHGDERGFFVELFQQQRFAQNSLPHTFVQDNLSRSRRRTLRGLHYQIERPQGKLVQVLRGAVFDVAVDLRRSSPAFGKSVCVTLTAESLRQFYVPPGCAHGFYVLSETADFFYKCTDFYSPAHERTLQWNDPALGIEWPLEMAPLLSRKDQHGTPLHACETYP